jgi:DNA polymerase III epsilon subunit-like protein
MTDSTLVFVDTETTSLRPDRRAWDIAFIVRRPGTEDVEHQWYIDAADLDLGNADPFALRIGHFYERHPQYTGELDNEPAWGRIHREDDVLREIEELTRGAHLVGCVPNFDADVLGARMRAHGILPSWHYHLIDVETLIVGYINGVAARAIDEYRMRGEEPPPIDRSKAAPPWKSDDMSRAVNVEPPDGDDRHTAMGDARWARDMYDAVTGVQVPNSSAVNLRYHETVI